MEVDFHQPIKIGFTHLIEVAPERDASVVEENIHPGVCAKHCGWQPRHRLAIRHVDAVPANPNTVGRGQRFGFVQTGLVDVGEREITSAPRQSQRNPSADAAPGARYHGDATLDVHGSRSLALNCMTPSAMRP
jgi:hypothetical protein